MGKLIKNHWARLIILTAAICTLSPPAPPQTAPADSSADQVAASFEGFFWPKIFWDFATKNLDGAVKPIPILQIINLLFGLFCLAWEWPLGWLSGTAMHRSIEARLVVFPLSALAALLLYQGTNAGLYYLIGMGVYFWAFGEGEVSGDERARVWVRADRHGRSSVPRRGRFLARPTSARHKPARGPISFMSCIR
jgi:hypothetical protein